MRGRRAEVTVTENAEDTSAGTRRILSHPRQLVGLSGCRPAASVTYHGVSCSVVVSMSSSLAHRRLLRTTVYPVCLTVLLLFAVVPAPAESPPTVGELVEQLGAASFQQREQAERQLQQLGAEALGVLRNAAEDADLEVRYRARRLIARIEHQQQWRLLEHFLSEYDPELAQQLPGWPRYAELVGDDRAARRLFVEMFETEPEIMSSLGRSPLGIVVEKRVLEMRPAPNARQQSPAIPAASTAVLLLASLEPGSDVSANTRSLINSLVNESAFQRALATDDDPPVRRLLAGWVAAATDVSPSIRMNIGSRFALSSAVVPAVELIESQVHGSQLQYAVFTIARLGTAEQIPVLEGLLDNPAVLSERQRGDEEPFTCQVRDVALAGLLHLIGKQPREFGFDQLRPNSNSLYGLNTAGFASQELRQDAFQKWHLWSRSQHSEGLDVGETAVAGARL